MKTKLKSNQQFGQIWKRTLLLLLISSSAIVACGSNTGEEFNYNPATKILRVEMTPDTLMQGDTLFIRCVVEDSLDPNLIYKWGLNKDGIIAVNGRIDSSVIRWKDNVVDRFRNYPDSVMVGIAGGYVVVKKTNGDDQYDEVLESYLIYIKRN